MRIGRLGAIVLSLASVGCDRGADVERLASPAAAGALAPSLAEVDGAAMLSWLEPVDGTEPRRHRLRTSRLEGESWSEPVTIVEGPGFFANWADLPGVVEDGPTLWAHWLSRTGGAPYAYTVSLARSDDGGRSWADDGRLPADASATEHGFVSYATGPDGVHAFWLDGRDMPDGQPMALRTAVLGRHPATERVVDASVCDCCATDAVATDQGPLVVYRDRDPDERRDISAVRRLGDGWSEPVSVHRDGWQIPGCPVNGPAVDADGDAAVVAWFTGATEPPRVQVAFSGDSGARFDAPIAIDVDGSLGRVDVVALDPETAAIVWLDAGEEGARVRVARAERDGTVSSPLTVGHTRAVRASGFPKMIRMDDTLLVAWLESVEEAPDELRVDRVPITRLR